MNVFNSWKRKTTPKRLLTKKQLKKKQNRSLYEKRMSMKQHLLEI
jgi:hypothetical protein